jgi:hypothetical protein
VRCACAHIAHGDKAEIKANVEDSLPLNSSGIVAVFEEKWADDVADALSSATNVTKEKVDADSAKPAKVDANAT